jgi:cysteine desulfurase
LTMRKVYLDNNATTPLDPEVFEVMRNAYLEDFGNPSSIHAYGQKARAALENARRDVAALIGAEAREIVFTSGGTEADNTAVRGVAYALRSRGDHIITSSIEHPAILRTCEQLEKEGFRVSYLPVGRDGLLDPDEVKKHIEAKTILISIMHVNNETGSVQPIESIASLAKEMDVLFHTDAVQSVGKLEVDVKKLNVDLLSLSSHKFHGPKGVGALYLRRGVLLAPLLLGGSHERSRRAGTENVPGALGLAAACGLARKHLADFGSRVCGLRDRLEQEVLRSIPQTTVNGSVERRAPHVSNLSFRHLEGEALLIALDFQGVAVSTGAACSSGSLQPSHVLKAMGQAPDLIHGSVRFSFSRATSAEDLDYVLDVLKSTVTRMREMSPHYREG